MKNMFQNRWLIFALRLVLGVIFIFACIAKFVDMTGFINAVAGYGILSDSLAHIYGYIVPWVELFVGCSLIFGVFVRFSAILSIPLVISFIVAGSYALVNAIGGSCGCFGTFLTMSHSASLILDVLMLFASVVIVFNKSQDFLSIRQLLQRFKVNSRAAIWGSRGFMAVLALFAIEFVSIQLYQYFTLPPGDDHPGTIVIISQSLADVDKYLTEGKPVVVFFYADGCPTCGKTFPLFYDIENKFINNAGFVTIDYYQNPQAVSDLNITVTPTVLVITGKNSDGTYNVLGRFEGVINRDALQTSIKQAIKRQ